MPYGTDRQSVWIPYPPPTRRVGRAWNAAAATGRVTKFCCGALVGLPLSIERDRRKDPAHRQVTTRTSSGDRRRLDVYAQFAKLMLHLQGIRR